MASSSGGPSPAVRTLGAKERTALAWQRSALALMAGAAILVRLTWDRLGLAALVILAVAVVLGTWVFIESRGRYADAIGVRPRRTQRGGRAPTFLCVSVVLIGAVELIALTL